MNDASDDDTHAIYSKSVVYTLHTSGATIVDMLHVAALLDPPGPPPGSFLLGSDQIC